MARMDLRLIGNMLTVLVVAASCSDPATSTPGTKTGEGGGLEACIDSAATSLDCFAKAEVRRLSNSQQMTGVAGEKTELQIGSLPLAGQLDVDFRISNVGAVTTAASLRIDDIWLEYTTSNPAEGTVKALSCWDSTGKTTCADKKGAWKKLVPPGMTGQASILPTQESFKIRYTQFDTKARSGRVCMRLGGDQEFSKKNLCFQVVTTAGKPKLKVQPTEVSFPYVQLGKQDTRPFSVQNGGESTLYLSKLEMTLDPAFSVEIGGKTLKPGAPPVPFDPPLAIAPGDSMQGTVVFKPTDDKKRSGEIKIFSNDPTIVGGFPVLVTANTKVPCILVTPNPVVNFGAVKVGSSQDHTISVQNCGTEKLSITQIGVQPGERDAFGLDFGTAGAPTAEAPWVLDTNESRDITGKYVPPSLSEMPDSSTVAFTSNASPVSLKLTGVCVADTCPVAIVTVQEGEEVVPQTVLHLKGSASYAPGGGSIAKYVWTIKKQPEGAKQTFVPGPTFPDPTFTANAAGIYEFCLDVYDDQSPPKKSCADACVEVLVIPSEALHVELLWKTPSDPDETDMGQGVGSDLDLHFAHQLAQGQDLDCDGKPDPWFSQPFDVFWFNPTPKWGSANTVDDDGRLDLDDTDGAGPENVNLDAPQGTASDPFQYAVGVHYWNDHGFGKSWATVRVYVLGDLKVEIKDQELNPVDMWYVGRINWPNEAMSGTGPVFDPCLQSGDACLAKKDPANPKGGQMWQATGSACIRPCYLSPLANSNSAKCTGP